MSKFVSKGLLRDGGLELCAQTVGCLKQPHE
jgi:hypothetical protein